jgi:Domain of unknown function (DUF6484)
MSSLKDKKSSRISVVAPPVPAGPAEVVIGRVAGIAKNGAPLVDYPGNPAGSPVRAVATAKYEVLAVNAQVALMFVGGDRARPLAIGLVVSPVEEPADDSLVAAPIEEVVTLTASREIVLQCGRASIVLTRAGKVLLRGAYVSSRSSGMQRITGASVQIN